MPKNIYCSICLSINKRTINIYATDLQYFYENLANFKIRNDECWMCYICHTRLRQCYQLQQLAVQTRGLIDDIFQNKIDIIFGAFGSVLELSIAKTNILSTRTHSSYIKHESDDEMEYYNDDGVVCDKNLASADDNKVEEKPCIVAAASLAGITQELSNLENDGSQKSKVIRFQDRRSRKTYPITEIYLEDRGEPTWGEQSTEYAEIKQEKKVAIGAKSKRNILGIDHYDQQDNTNDCEGRDRASKAQSGRYKKPHSCHVCLKYFASKSKLIEHTRTHTGVRPFSCNVCSKKFRQLSNLNRHNRIHTGERPFSCNICLKKFSDKRSLNTHILNHADIKPFSCDICPKKFTKKYTLNIHTLMHTDERPYVCHICAKKFLRKTHLETHLQTHTGIKPFSCDICSKRFTQKCGLNTHKLIHTGERPYICHICAKKFLRKIHLETHLQTHTGIKPFSCDICSKRFTQKSTLKTHKLLHTNENPYTCDICSRKFTQKRRLIAHQLLHTNEKTHTCDICLKKFKHKSRLNTHKLIHTDENLYTCDI